MRGCWWQTVHSLGEIHGLCVCLFYTKKNDRRSSEGIRCRLGQVFDLYVKMFARFHNEQVCRCSLVFL